MEITSSNFDQSLPVVERSIQTADFITFDTEFSGYTACDDDKGHDYDTMVERYQKMKKSVAPSSPFSLEFARLSGTKS